MIEFAENGLARRIDCYDPYHLDAAQARFAEIEGLTVRRRPSGSRPRSAPRLDRGADQAQPRDRGDGALARSLRCGLRHGDWGAMHARLAPDCMFDDCRRLALVSGGGELMLALSSAGKLSCDGIALRSRPRWGKLVVAQ